MQRGEVWWALLDELRPVVLLSRAEEPGLRAMHIVAAATADEKRGFVVLSGEEAADPRVLQQVLGSVDAGVAGVGVEIQVGALEGLPAGGVVRVGLPRDGRIFCTWLVTLPRESLVEQAGVLSGATLDQLTNALRLARVE
jgi:mRNA interferase MazF